MNVCGDNAVEHHHDGRRDERLQRAARRDGAGRECRRVASLQHFGKRDLANVAAVAVEEPHITPNAAEPPIVAYASPPRRCPRSAGNRVVDLRGKAGHGGEGAHQEEKRHGREIDVGEHARPARLRASSAPASSSTAMRRPTTPTIIMAKPIGICARMQQRAERGETQTHRSPEGSSGARDSHTSRAQHNRLDQDRAATKWRRRQTRTARLGSAARTSFPCARHLGRRTARSARPRQRAPARRPPRRDIQDPAEQRAQSAASRMVMLLRSIMATGRQQAMATQSRGR